MTKKICTQTCHECCQFREPSTCLSNRGMILASIHGDRTYIPEEEGCWVGWDEIPLGER